MGEAEETEKEIEIRSNEYRPVAKRASLLYFCLADLAVVRVLDWRDEKKMLRVASVYETSHEYHYNLPFN